MIGDSGVDDHRTARPGRADSEGGRYLRAHPSVDVLELLEEKEKDPVQEERLGKDLPGGSDYMSLVRMR